MSNEEPSLPLGGIKAQMSFLLGDILTIADGVFPPGQQNDAVKDLIKTRFYDRMNYVEELCTGVNPRAVSTKH